jgi:hypothetical protein
MSDFAPLPNDELIRAVVLALCRMTRWGRNEVLEMTYDEALWWLEGANELEAALGGAGE